MHYFFNFCLFAFIFTKQIFYATISSNDQKKLQSLYYYINENNNEELNPFKGALLMKLADYEKLPKNKLITFNKGKKILEQEIFLHPNSTERRFLRLIIQEHSPSKLGYNNNINEDAIWIKSHFQSLNNELKGFVNDYAKSSKYLNL